MRSVILARSKYVTFFIVQCTKYYDNISSIGALLDDLIDLFGLNWIFELIFVVVGWKGSLVWKAWRILRILSILTI